MQLSIERDPLIQALGQVMGAVDGKHTIPVLTNVLLETVGSQLRIVGTNLDIEVSTQADCWVIRPGKITAPARELLDIANKAVPGAQVEITFDPEGTDKRMKVKAGRSNYMLPTLPASDFPTMETVKDGVGYSMLCESLSRLLDKTFHAISVDKTRYFINGVHFKIHTDDADYLHAVSTDGKTLALAEMPAPDGSVDAHAITIPRNTVALMQRIVGGKSGDVTLTAGKTKIAIHHGNTTMVSKLIEGSFPDYMRLIPKGDGPTVATIKASELARGIDAAGIVNREKTLLLRFNFTTAGLAISGRNTDGGMADSELETAHDGNDIQIGFNARILRDISGVIGDGDLTFHIWDAASGVRIHDSNDAAVTFIGMPARA
jgi:DNA polymerase-3 subunit beta